ncbi:MAG: pilus assembly protein TadG-related protein [Myxococcaceae bacterium]
MKNQRGQSLLLFSLTLLLLAVMVLLTLSLGMRTRERMELQIAADAAAYSNAVATARTFNQISIMNRLQISYYVAMAANESLISWTGYGRGMLTTGAAAAGIIAARHMPIRTPCDAAMVANATQLAGELVAANIAIASSWEGDDQRAGEETRGLQSFIAGIREETEELSGFSRPNEPRASGAGSLIDILEKQTLTQQIAQMADQGSPTPGEITARVHNISKREVDCRVAGTTVASGNGHYEGAPGMCSNPDFNIRMLQAAMGSRGHPFVVNRSAVPGNQPIYDAHVPSIAAMGHRITGSLQGAATWGTGREDWSGTSTAHAWGEDHGTVTVTVNSPVCSDTHTLPLTAFVKSTHDADDSDEHRYGLGGDPDASEYHTMGSCGASCPSVWVRAIKFEAAGPGDLHGQPKNYAVLQRDYGVRPFGDIEPDANADDWDPKNPWNLSFRFRFIRGGEGQVFDNRGVRLGSGTSIRRQVAIATGLAYYHRRGFWDEFPNFLNPFWRATLVAADADETAQQDISAILTPDPWQQESFNALVGAGFKGFH